MLAASYAFPVHNITVTNQHTREFVALYNTCVGKLDSLESCNFFHCINCYREFNEVRIIKECAYKIIYRRTLYERGFCVDNFHNK